MVSASHWRYIAVMILIGFGTIILAFIDTPVQLQIALGLIGLGFISLGLVQIKRAQDASRSEERFNEIMAKLDEIQNEIRQKESQGKSGIAIADVITSGLKYYTEHLTQKDKEE